MPNINISQKVKDALSVYKEEHELSSLSDAVNGLISEHIFVKSMEREVDCALCYEGKITAIRFYAFIEVLCNLLYKDSDKIFELYSDMINGRIEELYSGDKEFSETQANKIKSVCDEYFSKDRVKERSNTIQKRLKDIKEKK